MSERTYPSTRMCCVCTANYLLHVCLFSSVYVYVTLILMCMYQAQEYMYVHMLFTNVRTVYVLYVLCTAL